MFLNNILPSQVLAEFVRIYRIVDFVFEADAPISCKAYTPRPEHCLNFYPRDTETVKYPNSNEIIAEMKVSLTGQHTIINNRFVGKDFLNVQVVFQPGALYRITGLPVNRLTNKYLDAEAIFGKSVRTINEQLYHSKDYKEMIKTVELFLISLIRKIKKSQHTVAIISRLMMQNGEINSLDWYLREACLCQRQFDRKFYDMIGINPKMFLRIIRFNKAYYMKNCYPDKDWLTVAIHSGYYDYQHLSKDYKEFTGYTPINFYEIDMIAPERLFGDVDTELR